MSTAAAPLIDVQLALSVHDGTRGFDLDVALRSTAPFVVLYGPSGSGKTLTLQAIAGLLAIVRQNWNQAVDLLGRLLELQGERASEFARMMYERALNCGGKASVPQRQELAATIE